MNTLDIVLVLLLILAFFMGFRRGLLLALFSLLGVIAGIYGGLYFSHYVAGHLESWFEWNNGTTFWGAFVITFLIISIVFSIIGNLLTKVADFAMLGIFNKLFGGIFNVLKYAFVISVVFMILNTSQNYWSIIFSEEMKLESKLYEPVAAVAPMVIPHILREIGNIDKPEIEPKNLENPPTEE